jgi:hypothetical protein
MQQTVQSIIALQRLQMERTQLEIEGERLRMLQLQQDAAAQDAAKQQQARASLFVIRAQNVAVMLLDTLQLVGEVRQAFWNDAAPNLIALHNVNPVAESYQIVEVLLPLARTYRERRDGFTARLLAILNAGCDSMKIAQGQRLSVFADAAKAAQPLFAHNLLTSTQELTMAVQPALARCEMLATKVTGSSKPE